MASQEIGAFTPEQARLIWQDYLTRQQLAPELSRNLPHRRSVVERGTRHRHVAIDTALTAPTTLTPTTCDAFLINVLSDGTLETQNTRVTVTNWDKTLSLEDGTVCKVEWITGRWEIYWAACEPDADILTQIEAIRDAE